MMTYANYIQIKNYQKLEIIRQVTSLLTLMVVDVINAKEKEKIQLKCYL